MAENAIGDNLVIHLWGISQALVIVEHRVTKRLIGIMQLRVTQKQ